MTGRTKLGSPPTSNSAPIQPPRNSFSSAHPLLPSLAHSRPDGTVPWRSTPGDASVHSTHDFYAPAVEWPLQRSLLLHIRSGRMTPFDSTLDPVSKRTIQRTFATICTARTRYRTPAVSWRLLTQYISTIQVGTHSWTLLHSICQA
jgi:hypothetical protein